MIKNNFIKGFSVSLLTAGIYGLAFAGSPLPAETGPVIAQPTMQPPVQSVETQAALPSQMSMDEGPENEEDMVWIEEVEFNDTNMNDVIRSLSELSNSNIIATREAANRQVTIHLKDVTILDAVKSISRISDLWYRYDEDTDTYRLMTREEYSKDLIIRESENIEIFRLLNANVQIIAQAIEDIYGPRVILSLGLPPASNNFGNSGFGGIGGGLGAGGLGGRGGSFGSVRSNNRSVRGSSRNGIRSGGGRGGFGNNNFAQSGTMLDPEELSIDQIDRIAQALELSGNRNIDQETLQQTTTQAQPIYVTVNNEHNMIIVRSDDKAVLSGIRQMIKQMDIPVPQVMLEMRILNVVLGEDINSIFNFQLEPSGSNQSQNPILLGNNALLNSGTFVYEFLNNRLRANLQFLEERDRIKVLSNPMVVASNHRPAELFIGEETLLTEGFEFFPAVIDNGIVLQQAFVEAQITREDIGITLRITPRINNDNTVELFIEQENSTVNVGGGTIPVGDTVSGIQNLIVDTVDTARLTGTVMAKNNLTVAVGGLIRTSENRNERKVPLLSEIPIVGRIFTSTIEGEEETETVLLITPRIMNVPGESEKIRSDGENIFYKSHNAGYPDPAEPPNRFIDKEEPSPEISEEEIASGAGNEQTGNNRQQIYMEMSEFASEMMHVSNPEQTSDPLYVNVPVKREMQQDLLPDNRLATKPLYSWNRGGLYVTAVQVYNTTNREVDVNYRRINGRWLASSIEKESLQGRDTEEGTTFMYLISVMPYEEMMSNVR